MRMNLIAINYHSADRVRSFYQQLSEQTYKAWNLTIVNNSPDDPLTGLRKSIGADRRVLIVEPGSNLGYASGNNYGFEAADEHNHAQYTIFSNTDITLLCSRTLSHMVEAFAAFEADFIGPKIIRPDGRVEPPMQTPRSFWDILMHRGNGGIFDRVLGSRAVRCGPVFGVSGAFLACKSESFRRAGLFDPNTFLYYEEEILFRRVMGWAKVLYVPCIEIHHDHSAVIRSTAGTRLRRKYIRESEQYLVRDILKSPKWQQLILKSERGLEAWLIDKINNPRLS